MQGSTPWSSPLQCSHSFHLDAEQAQPPHLGCRHHAREKNKEWRIDFNPLKKSSLIETQPVKSLGNYTFPWCAPCSMEVWKHVGQHCQHHWRLCMCLALPSWRTLWQSHFHSKHDHSGSKNSYPSNYFFRRNAYFRNELIHLEGSTTHLLVLTFFQPPKAYHQAWHSNFARLDK